MFVIENLHFEPVGNFVRVRSAGLASALPFFLFHCNTINLFIRRALFQISKLLNVYYWTISSCLLLWNKTSLFQPCMTFEDLFIQCVSSICFLHPDVFLCIFSYPSRLQRARLLLVSSCAAPDWGTGCLCPFSTFVGRGETTQNQTQFCLLHPLCTETSSTRLLWGGEMAEGPAVMTVSLLISCLWDAHGCNPFCWRRLTEGQTSTLHQ